MRATGQKRQRNELIRQILQICGGCNYGQGKGTGLVCTRKRPCSNKRVKQLLVALDKPAHGNYTDLGNKVGNNVGNKVGDKVGNNLEG